jgi:ADP-L-glycero-D-manno-heptose 6-epimerase
MSKTALVTGATGFVGSHLCERLSELGWEVIAIGSRHENIPICETFIEISSPNFELNNYSIPEGKTIDVCFHQAANNDTLEINYEKMIYPNYFQSYELFKNLALKHSCKQFVYASSCSVYGKQPSPYIESKTAFDPLNPYAVSKMLFEISMKKFTKDYKVNAVGLRYSNVYGNKEKHKGRRASMITQMLNNMKKDRRPQLFNYGEQQRDWVYIKDIVEINLLASNYEASNVFNAGSGEALSFNKLAEIINEELGTDLKPEYKENTCSDRYQEFTLCDLQFAQKELGYKPNYNAENSVRHYVRETKKPQNNLRL